MTLSSGTRFGPYEIADEIGAGGMGAVYRATNANLKRDVGTRTADPGLCAGHQGFNGRLR